MAQKADRCKSLCLACDTGIGCKIVLNKNLLLKLLLLLLMWAMTVLCHKNRDPMGRRCRYRWRGCGLIQTTALRMMILELVLLLLLLLVMVLMLGMYWGNIEWMLAIHGIIRR